MLVAWSNRLVTCSPIFRKRFRKLRNSESALGVAATARACSRAASACESKPASSEAISSRGPPVERESGAPSEAGTGALLCTESLGTLATRCPFEHVRTARKSRADARVIGYSTTRGQRSPSASFKRMVGGNRQSVRIPQLHESLRASVPPEPECRLVAVGEHDVAWEGVEVPVEQRSHQAPT